MAWSNYIVSPQKNEVAHAVATTGKSTYADATNAVLLYTAPAEGAVLVRLTAIPRATVTATQLQLYSSTDGGTTLYLVKTKLMPAYTMAQTTEAIDSDFGYVENVGGRRILAPSEKLYVAVGVTLSAGIVFRGEFQN